MTIRHSNPQDAIQETRPLVERVSGSEAEIATIVKRTEADRWVIAQNTYEQVTAGMTRADWSRAVGFSEQSRTASRYFTIWERWGSVAKTKRPPMSECWNIVIGRVEGGYAKGQFDKLPEDKKAEFVQERVADMPLDKQAAIVREIVKSNPDVIDQVVTDTPTVAAIDAARGRVATQRLADAGQTIQPTDPLVEQDKALAVIRHGLMKINALYRECYTNISTLDSADRLIVQADLKRTSDWHELVTLLVSGQSIDDALAELLSEGR